MTLLEKVKDGIEPAVILTPFGEVEYTDIELNYILSGSFHPIHAGHVLMAKYVEDIKFEDKFAFELSLTNSDKGDIPINEVKDRVKPILELGFNLIVTKAPTFAQKACLFPHTSFMVGIDTLIRIDDPKYYLDNSDIRNFVLRRMLAVDHCRFLTFPRDGKSLKDYNLSQTILHMTSEATDFVNNNISSSDIRNNNAR